MANIVINPDVSSLYPLTSDNVFGLPDSFAPHVSYAGLIDVVLTGTNQVYEDDEFGHIFSNTAGYLRFVTNWNNGGATVNTVTIFQFVNFYSQTDYSGPGGTELGNQFADITSITTDGITFTPDITSNTYNFPSYLMYIEALGHGGGVFSPTLRTAYSGLPADLLAGNDTITNLSSLSATLLGHAGNDHLIAGSAGDILDGGTGSDVMDGGSGNDTFYVDSPTDVVHDGANGGFDTIYSTTTWHATAGSELEMLVAASNGNIALTGNSHAMAILGNAGVNTLDDGGAADKLGGGANADTYIVHNQNTFVFENANEGYDTVKTDLDYYKLPTNVEVLRYIGTSDFHGVVGDHAEAFGASGNDTLEGGAFSRLSGGGGNDTYIINSSFTTVIEAAGQGNDTVKVSANQFTAPNNVENLVFTGTGTFNGYGNTTGVSIIGSSAGGTLFGGAGNDTLNGNGGNTTMFGNGGADNFVINPYDKGLDRIVDFHSGEDHLVFAADSGFFGFNQLQNYPTPSDFPRFNADFLEYNKTTGDMFLFKTEDESFTKVAHFDNHPELTINDFTLV